MGNTSLRERVVRTILLLKAEMELEQAGSYFIQLESSPCFGEDAHVLFERKEHPCAWARCR